MNDRDAPPPWLRPALDALQRGDWQAAHELVQHEPGKLAAWVHAHVHRIEGDDDNAAWWYRRAGLPFCREPLAVELEQLRASCR